jgi:ABC transporter, phosphonate, periplasmic substrate-binding protein
MSRLKLRAQTWLAPSVPFELHRHALGYVAERLDIEIDLRAETRWSGPPPDEVDPFFSGEIDLGFFCAPSYLRLAPAVRLVSAAPLFADRRVGKSPVYYSEIVVRRDHPAKTVRDLAGSRWGLQRQRLAQWLFLDTRCA